MRIERRCRDLRNDFRKEEKGVSQHILTDETGSRAGHFFGFASSPRTFWSPSWRCSWKARPFASAIRYGKARSLLRPRYGPCRERPGRPLIGDVLFHGLALTKQALGNSLSETGIAIRFSESVYLFRSPGTCYSGPSKSVKQSVHRFR